MAFTNEDLQNLKEEIADKPNEIPVIRVTLRDDTMRDIIARLEAAEKLIKACGSDVNVSKLHEAWLKSCGI